MRCPKCGNNHSRVIDSRQSEDNRAIRRRRQCENCGFRFTTFERIESPPILVVKKDGTREEFKREKILNGIVRSAEKRPVSMEEMENSVARIEKRILENGSNEISSISIGEYVMEELAELDEVAYIRFASVYRQFKDMSVFMKELEEMMQKMKKEK
ncbi:MAG: transcriptional regulator NrdR [Streptococcaceae bacterium]|jgi:transcriptional repressor NrdR|nr:transcriptional regulator NrdR [Streptococcaceae bacterium]